MKTKYLLLSVIFFVSISINAQKTDKIPSQKPASIYTVSHFSDDKNSFWPVNKKLNLTNFYFVTVDDFTLDFNRSSLNSKNFGKESSGFIYQDYKRIQDRNLLKGFLLKNDPTRWNSWCHQRNSPL
tara:strand:+ start:562 stop:939 length:378 start_codon:yes stop_codon:yes gene_type:complete